MPMREHELARALKHVDAEILDLKAWLTESRPKPSTTDSIPGKPSGKRRRLFLEGLKAIIMGSEAEPERRPCLNFGPWAAEVKGAGSAQMNGLYYRREVQDGPPKTFKIPKGRLEYFNIVLEAVKKTFEIPKAIGEYLGYFGAAVELATKLTEKDQTLTEKEKEYEAYRLNIWTLLTDGRQWYEKDDGSYIYWSAKCEYNTPNELVMDGACGAGKAEWRLSDVRGNVYYKADPDHVDVGVSCMGKEDCSVLPPSKGWETNDFNGNIFRSGFGRSGLAPSPTVHYQE